jgi:hypothetical protein
MFLSGVAMAIADVGFLAYGVMDASLKKREAQALGKPHPKKHWENALAGASYLAGSTVLSLYGHNDQADIQIREMAQLILNRARDQGYDIPDDSAVASMGSTRKESVLRKVNNFFREYPSEIGNMLYFTAGAFVAKSAYQYQVRGERRPDMTDAQVHEMRTEGKLDTGLGVTTMISGLIATFFKEKATDPDQHNSSGLNGWVKKLMSSPLAIASLGYMGSTGCHAVSTVGAFRAAGKVIKDPAASAIEKSLASEKRRIVPFRGIFVAFTLLGEFLLAISSRGHGEGVVSDNTVDNSVIAVAADLIARQSSSRQAELISYMAGFLGRPDVLAMKDEEVQKLLRTQVEALHKNPWVQAQVKEVAVAQTISDEAKAQPMPALAAKEFKSWQARTAASEASVPSIST